MALLGSNVVEEKCRRTNKLSLHTRKAPQPLHRITTSTGALQLPPQQNGIIARATTTLPSQMHQQIQI